MTANEAARSLAIQFAGELKDTHNEAQNWRPLDQNDDLPEFDYVTLRNEFGAVTSEMESAYREAFNDIFVFAARGEFETTTIPVPI